MIVWFRIIAHRVVRRLTSKSHIEAFSVAWTELLPRPSICIVNLRICNLKDDTKGKRSECCITNCKLFGQLFFGFVRVSKILLERGKQCSLMRHSIQASPYRSTGITFPITQRREKKYLFQKRPLRRLGESACSDSSCGPLDDHQLASLVTAYPQRFEQRCSRKPPRAVLGFRGPVERSDHSSLLCSSSSSSGVQIIGISYPAR